MTAVNENALCVTRDGEIFLGGTQGMISFHEMELNFTPKPYKIILSRLIVNGTEIQVGDETGILQQSLYCTPEITLNADQSMFSIEFATSNYVAANKDDIIYKLEGFSNDWNSARGLHNITYTNLNAGTYNLIIKPNGKDESLCPQVHLTIHVLPPYYKTPLAYLIYLIVTGILLWYLVRTYKSRIKLRESLKYEQKHIRDVEALNQSKLRFFTNISHEFRTPLTLIVAQVETLMQLQNFTPAIYNKVLGIYKNSIQLRELITELLDFRKQEQGHMKIKVSPHNIVNFLYENYLLFLEYASAKQISLYFEKETDSLEVWYDQKQMQKVINNLLSNAVKHTKAEDSITLSIKTEGSNAVIRVTDTGSGIDAREVDKIFDRFYQIDQMDSTDASKTGTGIGLALTKGANKQECRQCATNRNSQTGKRCPAQGGAGRECSHQTTPGCKNPDSGRQRLHPRHAGRYLQALLRSADCGRRSGRTCTGAQRNAQYRSQRRGDAQHVGNGTVQTDKERLQHLPYSRGTAHGTYCHRTEYRGTTHRCGRLYHQAVQHQSIDFALQQPRELAHPPAGEVQQAAASLCTDACHQPHRQGDSGPCHGSHRATSGRYGVQRQRLCP